MAVFPRWADAQPRGRRLALWGDAIGDLVRAFGGNAGVLALWEARGGTPAAVPDARGSAFGTPILQATSAKRPTQNADGSLEFNGSGACMSTALATAFALQQALTWWTIAAVKSGGVGAKYACGLYTDGATGEYLLLNAGSNADIRVEASSAASASVTAATGEAPSTTVRLYLASRSGATSAAIRGQAYARTAGTASPGDLSTTTSPNKFCLGDLVSNAAAGNGAGVGAPAQMTWVASGIALGDFTAARVAALAQYAAGFPGFAVAP